MADYTAIGDTVRAFGKGVPDEAFHVEAPGGALFCVLQVKGDVPGNMGLAPCSSSFRDTPFPNAWSVRKRRLMPKFLGVFLF